MSEDEASEASDEIAAGSSTAAMAGALKDQLQQQFQQLQHSLAIQLQNLGNLPYLPAIPGLALPLDYQAYLHRMQQFVPGMSGPRPGPAGLSEESGSKVDGRWWGLGSSVNNNSSALPPAYEDIFPQGGKDSKQDVKQASAIRAAAEAEADVKCATLYDESPLAMKTRLAGKSTVEKPVSEETLAKELAPEETAVEEPAPEETGAEELAPEESGPKMLKIGRKNAITRAQQEQFLRAREIKLKSLRSDRNLFFIWVSKMIFVLSSVDWLASLSAANKVEDTVAARHDLCHALQLLSLAFPVCLELGARPGAGWPQPCIWGVDCSAGSGHGSVRRVLSLFSATTAMNYCFFFSFGMA